MAGWRNEWRRRWSIETGNRRETRPGFGQLNVAGMAQEEWAGALLRKLDLVAHDGQRYAGFLVGAGEVPMAGDCIEAAEG